MLPRITTPIYELEIPSSKKKIRYRPFLVKEEKILIIAMESEDGKQIANAVKSVISNCILSKGVKVEDLATFDIEYLIFILFLVVLFLSYKYYNLFILKRQYPPWPP